MPAVILEYDDILSVSFSVDDEEVSGSISKATYSDAMRYSCLYDSTDLSEGTHTLNCTVTYSDGGDELAVAKEISMLIRNHDCSLDGHRLIHHAATTGNYHTQGSIEYWHCDYCGSLFLDAQGNTEIRAEDIVVVSQPFEVSYIGADGNNSIVHITVPANLSVKHIIIATYRSGKMASCYLCSEPIMEAIMSSEGSNVAVMHGDVIKVFLLDDNYCPMFSCTEINPR